MPATFSRATTQKSSFFNTLKQHDYSVFKTIEFPDHHYFSREDLDRLNKIAAANNLTLITTEKDFVRIPKEIRLGIECLKIEIVLDKMNEDRKKKIINLANEFIEKNTHKL